MKIENAKYTCVIFETFEDSGVTKPTNTKKRFSKQGNIKMNRNYKTTWELWKLCALDTYSTLAL